VMVVFVLMLFAIFYLLAIRQRTPRTTGRRAAA